MFTRLVIRSLRVRKERFLVSVIAIMLGAAVVTSLLTVSLDIREKMGKELRSYGANLIVLPGEGEYIDQFDATHSSIIGSVPFLYFKTGVNAKNVEFAGTDIGAARKMNPWWHIEGRLPEQDEVLAGINAAKKLGLKAGDALSAGNRTFKVSGILDTGTSDDNRIFIPMKTAEAISGKSGATLVQVSVLGNIDDVVKYLENKNYKVKKVMQVAESEEALLDKTQLLMALVAFFVLSAACLCLLSTMITGVLERSREIGLMKALGCANERLAAIFLTEAGVIGIAGGTFGYLVGLLLSQLIGMKIFDVQVSVKPEVFALTLLISITISVTASLLPVRRAVSIDPVVILRGE
ncbi:ABC transporter permease [Candidatus Methanoperedens nitratireducens]|uniref:Putative Efflux ABC transporter, permease protein n=1 Tax=Candidatus Methanoperedens nitratireducens TaxID=1392998 RepID=A0A284VJR2_9EURY|nr:FtsX-like permease family protein [Candidatus Methanoperedens nitroreducens]SNQ59490.1 putative Efflux ABC transporter, permease protein [Candidatus Methanoperedens nitroreducens]